MLHRIPKVRYLSTLLLTTAITYSYAAGKHDHHHHHEKHHAGHHMSAVGEPAHDKDVTKTIHVTMLDTMKYEFDGPLDIKEGDVIRFVVKNEGKILHEFSIGNAAEQKKHAEMMKSMPDMIHEDPNTLSLEAGGKGELIWRFKGKGEVVFACNIPGHYEAGMFAKASLK